MFVKDRKETVVKLHVHNATPWLLFIPEGENSDLKGGTSRRARASCSLPRANPLRGGLQAVSVGNSMEV